MKSFFLLLVILTGLAAPAMATDYYSTGSGTASDPARWNTKRDGSGTSPVVFTKSTDRFIVQPGHRLSGSFQCAGSLSVEHDGSFTITRTQPTVISSVITINQGGVFCIQKGATVRGGFLVLQGDLQNLGGKLDLDPSYAMLQQ